mmetsp:Transcript_3412/g.9707  ORF Transcript_3412/g.9707 Transcript_3412/m.9707 type:complete len:172 (-) Transcript_3412:17-532(-)
MMMILPERRRYRHRILMDHSIVFDEYHQCHMPCKVNRNSTIWLGMPPLPPPSPSSIDTVMRLIPSFFLPDHVLPIRFILRQRISSSSPEREIRHSEQVDTETLHDHCNHWQLPTIRWAWNGTNASHHTMRGIYAMSKVSEKVSNEMQKCGGQATKGGTGSHKKPRRMRNES